MKGFDFIFSFVASSLSSFFIHTFIRSFIHSFIQKCLLNDFPIFIIILMILAIQSESLGEFGESFPSCGRELARCITPDVR